MPPAAFMFWKQAFMASLATKMADSGPTEPTEILAAEPPEPDDAGEPHAARASETAAANAKHGVY